MNLKAAYIFKAIDRAGVSITDLSRLTGISRTSLYSWRLGKHISDQIRLNIAYEYAEAMVAAVKVRRLPLRGLYSPAERLKTLRIILKDVKPVK